MMHVHIPDATPRGWLCICMGVAWASHGDLLGMPAVETAGDGG